VFESSPVKQLQGVFVPWGEPIFQARGDGARLGLHLFQSFLEPLETKRQHPLRTAQSLRGSQTWNDSENG
jgi:hypothetical protein